MTKKRRLTKEKIINQDIFNDDTLQKQQRQENQRKFDENCLLNENNLLKNESNQKMFIHEVKKFDKRDTQLNFAKFIFNDNHIFKKSIIIENNEEFLITHERRDEILESILDSNGSNDDFKIKIYYKFRERKAGRNASSFLIDSFDTSEIERVDKKYLRKKIKLVASNFRFLDSENCFYVARDDENNTVFFISKDDNRDFDEHLLVSKINTHYDTQNQEYETKKNRRH